MCRFVGYLGRQAIILNEILDKPENSLINQSRKAREGKYGLNADGFGIGWYDQSISAEPGIFKSVQPAWNDNNLRHLAAKIRSTCFVGHVRASTVGDVNTFNCHPFAYKQFLFVHNGTIRGFINFRRILLQQLSEEFFTSVKGQTDSEHFFALLMELIFKEKKTNALDYLTQKFTIAIQQLNDLQRQTGVEHFSRLNTLLTDGKRMIATRYVSTLQEAALSLYYTTQPTMTSHSNAALQSILVASEKLTDYAEEWQEVPVNHMLLVDEDFSLSLQKIDI